MARKETTATPLLEDPTAATEEIKKTGRSRPLWFLLLLLIFPLVYFSSGNFIFGENNQDLLLPTTWSDIVESENGVVAADDGRCSEVGVSVLRRGGHAVDAAVATALCVGVVNPMSSGIGGGAFMVVRSANASNHPQAFDMRETAPLAASKDMYENNKTAKYLGALSMGVPGEIAGLYQAWKQHGRLPWKTLFQPAIRLARDGFTVSPYLGQAISTHATLILNDPGLRNVFAPDGRVLGVGETCYNAELGRSLEAISVGGPGVLYDGPVGEKLVKDVRNAGGILTVEDLKGYTVKVTDAMAVDVMGGYTVHGMPPPSSGTAGFSMVLHVLDSYASFYAANGNLGLHRLIEAIKHMFAARMELADPALVNITDSLNRILSRSFAQETQQKILDNVTFPPEYYMYRWNQLRDHGTSHFCVVDSDRNAVSMTTTVNYVFGAGVLSPSTGIILNNEMDDFSIPTAISPDELPPAPANFIQPNKRPLSSMTPLIITKGDKLIGAIGGSGGMKIIPAVIQVFLNHFFLGTKPLDAVQRPRIYHKLIPNVVAYENWTVIDGEHIELADDSKVFLRERGHELEAKAGGAIVQFVVQTFKEELVKFGRKMGSGSKNGRNFRGMLTAVSDPRKDGKPAAV